MLNFSNDNISSILINNIKYNIKSVPLHATEQEWNSDQLNNYIPKQGEIVIYDTDITNSYPRLKIGDGVSTVSNLSFILDQYLTKTEAQTLYAPKNILEIVYPIGAIYLSVNNIDPNVLFGFGSWEQIKDTFLLASGDTYSAGSTGGEATHTLTAEEMPAHTHDFHRLPIWKTETVPTSGEPNGFAENRKSLTVYRDTTYSAGNGQPHNNMPPYLAVYMWKRID